MKGTVVGGKYRIGEKLGAGGMGTVYEAVNTSTGRRVAVKIITAEAAANADALERFEREARAAGAIDSQHIAQVLDAGTDDDGTPFMVMEHLDGEDLRALSERLGPLAPDLALRIVTQAALGLEKAHAAGFVHRDVKPANIFLAKRDAGECVVKVLDFGVAKVRVDPLATRENDALTRTGSLVGSPRYMSPEQARGKKTLDHRADVWGLGAVLHELLAGTTPHEDAESLGELILMLCSKPVPSVRERAAWVSPAIASIVERCLATDPKDRFGSMAELVRATSVLLRDGWTIRQSMIEAGASPDAAVAKIEHAPTASAPRATTTLTSTMPPPDAPPASSVEAVARPRAERWRPVIALASVLVVGGTLVALGVASRPEAPASTTTATATTAAPSVEPLPSSVPAPDASASIALDAAPPIVSASTPVAVVGTLVSPKLKPRASASASAAPASSKPDLPGLVKDTSEFH